jgi:putative spermidine/putrescine transport system ATP-binding protein
MTDPTREQPPAMSETNRTEMTGIQPFHEAAAAERDAALDTAASAEILGSRGVALTLRNLVKQYPKTPQPAVRDVNLDIAPGEFMTFLGPSGSGKTTTLNMIAGFVSVTSGEILIAGEDVARMPAHKRDIGMVFQHYALFPHMTAAQNVAFPLEQRKVSKEETDRKVRAALASVHLEDFAARLPRQLSGGQQQRVAVARAIVYSPRVLLMDEPLGALDKHLREQLQSEITRLHRELGLTFVYVTHDQEEALALSDRIAVFNDGGIEQVGTPDELYESPRTVFVAEFLGDSNVLRGTVSQDLTTLKGTHYELALRPGQARVRPGGSGAVVVRPERIHVLPEGTPARATDNVLDATVSEVVYLGAARKVVLEFPWGGKGLVREPIRSASAAERGDRVRVAWAPEESVVVPGGPDMDYTGDGGEEAS